MSNPTSGNVISLAGFRLSKIALAQALDSSIQQRVDPDYLCARIQAIADNLGIDVEAPFRRRGGPK